MPMRRLLSPAAAAVVAALLSAPPLFAQEESAEVTGTVTDASSAMPIPQARIRFPGLRLETVSDEAGRFSIRLPRGVHGAEISALGYVSYRPTIRVDERPLLRFSILLEPSPVPLPAVDAEAAARRDPRLLGFWERRDRGLGFYMTRDDIERLQATQITEVFHHVPNARVVRTDAWGEGHVVTMSRRAVAGAGAYSNVCAAMVYLDGAEYRLSETGLDHIRAEEIEAIEVYSGPARLPAQFAKTGSPPLRRGQINTDPQCGVILLWTRAR